MSTLNVLMIKEDDLWVAQGLEHDISAQGKDMEEATYEFQKAFFSEMAVCEDLGYSFPNGIPPAPQYYWKMFVGVGMTMQQNSTQKYRVPNAPKFEIREVRAA